MNDFPPVPAESGSRLSRRALLRLGLPAAASLFALPGTSRAEFAWKLVPHNGRDYVTADDIAKFYGFGRVAKSNSHVEMRSATMKLRLTEDLDEIFINDFKFCLSYPVIEKEGKVLVSRVDLAKLIEPVLRPTHIGASKMFDTVVIDAGHGGHDSGADGPYGNEKDYTLDTALRLSQKLKALGFKTVLTRATDVFIELSGRAAIANKVANCIFVSLHFNSGPSSASGLETFALAPQGAPATDKNLKERDLIARRGNIRDSENIALATAVHANMKFKLGGIDRGVKRERFTVLTGLDRPGVLIEGGFVTNRTEGAKINNPTWRESLAMAVAGGIMNYRNALRNAAAASTRVPVKRR